MFRNWLRRCTPLGNRKHCTDHCPAEMVPGGECPLPAAMTLDCLQLNETGEIDTVPDESILEALGFRPGKRVCLRCRARFGGPVVAEIEGRHTALARSLARKIQLRSEYTAAPEYE